MGRWPWLLVVAVATCISGARVTAATFVEGWRSDPGTLPFPVCLSVNTTDGSCWVGDKVAGVVHLSAAGTELWRSTNSAFSSPTALSVNPTDGSCWVSDNGHEQVVHLSATGTELWRSVPGFVNWPGSVSVDPADGSCWIADFGGDQVLHLSSTGGELWRSAAGAFRGPRSVSLDPTDSSCWVADQAHNQIVHLSKAGAELWRSDATTFELPEVVSAVPSDGSCWVADSYHQRVVHLSAAGGILCSVALGWPTPVAANADGSCWVADIGAGRDQMVYLSPTGASLWQSAQDTYAADAVSVNSADSSCWLAANTGEVVKLVLVPAADFAAAPTSGSAPLPVSFTYLEPATPTWGAATAWQWSFGDGGGSAQKDPSYTYTKPGAYTVTLVAGNAGRTTTVTKPHCIVVSFADVPVEPPFWALSQVLACVEAGIVTGYPGSLYGPDLEVTRDQMAAYISRALAGGDAKIVTAPAVASFPDVPTDYWAYKYVEYAKSKGIVAGYTPTLYAPTLPVTRDQMAVFIARSIVNPTGDGGLSTYTPPSTASFSDVPTSHWAYRYIEYIKSKSITGGYPDGLYHPELVVTRDQMAVYVARAFQLPM